MICLKFLDIILFLIFLFSCHKEYAPFLCFENKKIQKDLFSENGNFKNISKISFLKISVVFA